MVVDKIDVIDPADARRRLDNLVKHSPGKAGRGNRSLLQIGLSNGDVQNSQTGGAVTDVHKHAGQDVSRFRVVEGKKRLCHRLSIQHHTQPVVFRRDFRHAKTFDTASDAGFRNRLTWVEKQYVLEILPVFLAESGRYQDSAHAITPVLNTVTGR